jgi:hypothetical protein
MPNLGNIILNLVLILVAGGLGALLAGLLAHYMVHWTTRRRAPQVVVEFFRTIGGLTAMVLAYLVLSTGGGGFGLGTGGLGFNGQGLGTGTGTGKGTGKGTGSAVATTEPPPTTKGDTAKKVDKVEPGMMLKVEMLGGKRYQPDSNRFYLIEGDKEPKTLAELTAIMQEKQKTSGIPGIEIIIYRTGSVAATHGAVKDLKDRAGAFGLAVKFTTLDQDAPPLP